MNPFLVLGIAILVTAFHIWACRRSPKYWYLGGIVPLVWLGLVVCLWFHGRISLSEDWSILLFPTAILLLLWLKGSQDAKKRELERMRAKDL